MADSNDLDVGHLCRLAETQSVALSLMQEFTYNLAIGIANLQTLLMPGNFILYGGVALGSERMLALLQRDVRDLAFSHPRAAIEISYGNAQQNRIALHGAAGLVIGEQLRIQY
jgi:predicted NBD/HSP70 family sugar kinase